jgi:hypothetical protein
MQTAAPKRTRRIIAVSLMLAGLGAAYAAGAFSATTHEEVLSFEMWCLEMRLYSEARCDARRADDVKAYEQYRATAERYDAAQAAREKRDKELQQRLNRDTSPKPGTPAR